MSKELRKLGRELLAAGKTCRALGHDVLNRFGKNDLSSMAASLAFTTVLSIAPLIAVAFYVFKLFGGFAWAYDNLMPYVLGILSEGTGAVVEEHLGNFVRQVQAKAVGLAGIGGLLLTTVTTYLTVVKAFNKIWEVDRPRSLQHRVVRALILVTVGPLLMAASIALTTAVAAQVKSIPFSSQLIAYALNTIVFGLVYWLVPMVRIPPRLAFTGAILPAALLELAKWAYAVYTKKMVSYSAFYGSFAAVPLFLLWIYIAWLITLFGAAWVRTLQLHGRKT